MVKEYVKNYKEQIEQIKNKQSEIDAIIATLPDSSWKDALLRSSENINKKLDSFLVQTTELSEEQKQAIAAIKSGKLNAKEILSTLPSSDENPTSANGSHEQKPTKSKKKSSN